jgi:hypothetical protein
MESLNIEPDFAQAADFLSLLAPDDEITFQTIPESPGTKALDKRLRQRLSQVLHGSFEEHRVTLAALNDLGAGVFFMVNRGDGRVRPGSHTCRTTANVTAVRALYVDLDGAPVGPVIAHHPAPTVVVESSPGKYHSYWPIPDCPLDAFTSLQQRLAAQFSGDTAVCDLPRVMRVPGFHHLKRTPFRTHVCEVTEKFTHA